MTTMKEKEVLYVLLPQFAEHEIPFLSQPLRSDDYTMKENPSYINKVVAASMKPVEAISGFRVLPDYTFDTIPKDYAALVLIGGYGWLGKEAQRVAPIVADAIDNGKIVGAICNGVSWMAKQGFLNGVRHTGNGKEQLQLWGGEKYTNGDNYMKSQVVSDGNVVTANGSAHLEFACEMLGLLQNDTPERIALYEQFYKQGFVFFREGLSL